MVELSIVIMVIGVAIAAIVKSSSLFYAFKEQAAQRITQNSSLNTIDGLYLWYETTMEDSFLTQESVDGGKISIWKDVSHKTILAQARSNKASGINLTQGIARANQYFLSMLLTTPYHLLNLVL